MTYTRGVPNEDEQGRVSQPKLLQNTNALDDIFGIDHYQFSDGTNNRGKHGAVRFKDQTSEGDPSTLSDEFAVFSKLDTDGDLELFYREPSNGDVNQLTKTGNIFSGLVPAAAVNFNNTGAIQSEFNVSSVTVNGAGDFTVNFTNALPDNNYDWSISAMASLSALIATVKPGNYNTNVTTTSITIQTRNLNNQLTNPIRVTLMIFRPPA